MYSRPSLPVPKDAISRQEDVNRWPHLDGVKIESINADIGLLIGSDVPQALQPGEIKQSQNGGPFATRTALGWVLYKRSIRQAQSEGSYGEFRSSRQNP